MLFKAPFNKTTLGQLYEYNQPGSGKKVEELAQTFRDRLGITQKDRMTANFDNVYTPVKE